MRYLRSGSATVVSISDLSIWIFCGFSNISHSVEVHLQCIQIFYLPSISSVAKLQTEEELVCCRLSLGFLKFKLTICKGDLLTDLVNLSVQTHQRGQYHYANLTNVVNLTVHWLLRQVVGQMGSGFASQAHLNPVIVSVYLYVWHTLCICIFVCMCICICICSCICICVCGYCQTIVKQSYSRLTTRQDGGHWSVDICSQADLHLVKMIHKCLIFIRYLPTFLQFNLDTREVESDTYFIDLTYISELILNLQKLG